MKRSPDARGLACGREPGAPRAVESDGRAPRAPGLDAHLPVPALHLDNPIAGGWLVSFFLVWPFDVDIDVDVGVDIDVVVDVDNDVDIDVNVDVDVDVNVDVLNAHFTD